MVDETRRPRSMKRPYPRLADGPRGRLTSALRERATAHFSGADKTIWAQGVWIVVANSSGLVGSGAALVQVITAESPNVAAVELLRLVSFIFLCGTLLGHAGASLWAASLRASGSEAEVEADQIDGLVEDWSEYEGRKQVKRCRRRAALLSVVSGVFFALSGALFTFALTFVVMEMDDLVPAQETVLSPHPPRRAESVQPKLSPLPAIASDAR